MTPSLLEEALNAQAVILSQMGPHAGEDERQIFARKIDDIRSAGETFWLHGSSYGMPNHVQQFVKSSAAPYVLFITPSGRADDMRDPKDPYVCSEYSHDKHIWRALPQTITPVTGSKQPPKIRFGAGQSRVVSTQIASGTYQPLGLCNVFCPGQTHSGWPWHIYRLCDTQGHARMRDPH